MARLSTGVTALMFGLNAYALGYDLLYESERGEGNLEYRGYAGKFKYLTFWSEIIQTLYFGHSLINCLIGSNLAPDEHPESRSALQKVRDFCVATIVFPIGSFVVITFWILYAIDRELVFPKALDQFIPAWLNHAMHTTVIVFLLIDKFIVYHHYPSLGVGLVATVSFALIYQLWMLWIAYYANLWVYPILEVLNWPGRIGFLAGCWLILIALYCLGELITRIIWQPDKVSMKKRK